MPLIPTVIEGLVDVNKSTETFEGLAETVFIQTVDTPPLTVIASILTSDLPQKSQSATKRAYIRIIENMSKLVEEPRNLINFIALWPPKFESNHDNLSDPECHEICKVTHDVFIRKTDVSRSKNNLIDNAMILFNTVFKKCIKNIFTANQPIVDLILEHFSPMFIVFKRLNELRRD